MIKLSCRFARSFKIMRIPQPIIPFRAPPQPVTVLRSGSADVIDVLYIRCLNGRVPECYELWDFAEDGVREFHPYARVKLLSEFRGDTVHTHFFIWQGFQIPFSVRRSLNESVEFLNLVRTTQHVRSRVAFSPNIFVHPWVVNPADMITPNVSTIARRAYDPIVSFRGFVLRSNHERLRLKRIELKCIRVEEYLARICQDIRDEVAANLCAPVNNALGDALSNYSDSDDGYLDRYDSGMAIITWR